LCTNVLIFQHAGARLLPRSKDRGSRRDENWWIAALFARPVSYAEYEEQRAIAAQRNAAKSTRKPKETKPCPPS
jgi:hypothetical protein